MKELINNVISGFNFTKPIKIAINYWGEDTTYLNLIVEKLESENHTVYINQVQLSKILNDVLNDTLRHDKVLLSNIHSTAYALDVFTHPPMLPSGFPMEKIKDFQTYLNDLFEAMGNEKKFFIQWRLPTKENAIKAHVDPDLFTESYISACLVDYETLKKNAALLRHKLKNKSKVTIHTEDHKLTFNLGDRVWEADVGLGDIPCGELAIAPIEESAQGSLIIKNTKIDNNIIENLILEFNQGFVTSSNKEFNQYLERFQEDKNIIAEFGIGLNNKINQLIHDSLHDEKMLNTVHIAIGMNSMFGGKNHSNLHHDFVFVPDRVYVDDLLIFNEGKLNLD